MPSQNSRHALQALLFALALTVPFQSSWAAKPASGGSCAGAPIGTYAYIEGTETEEGQQLVCDGTHWQSMSDYADAAKLIKHDNKPCDTADKSDVIETDTNLTNPTSGKSGNAATE